MIQYVLYLYNLQKTTAPSRMNSPLIELELLLCGLRVSHTNWRRDYVAGGRLGEAQQTATIIKFSELK